MVWVYKKEWLHECNLPFKTVSVVSVNVVGVAAGDVWQCDECLKTYSVRRVKDQRDGDYYQWQEFDARLIDKSDWRNYKRKESNE